MAHRAFGLLRDKDGLIMAYYTGSANTINALQTAIFTACTTSGWSLSGSTLSKGVLHMQIDILAMGGAYGSTGLRFRGGTGVSGGVVTGAATYASDIGTYSNAALTFPLEYHVMVFSDPDEVYVVVNYSADRFQYAAWGRSHLSLPASGMWFGASLYSLNQMSIINSSIFYTTNNGPRGYSYSQPMLFMRGEQYSNYSQGYTEVHMLHGLDGISWTTGGSSAPSPSAMPAGAQLLGMLPNAWNSESILLPIQLTVPRPSNRKSIVASLRNARYLRIDNHEPGDIITLGPDRWKVFPWMRKNTVQRNGMASESSDLSNIHTGTFGWAIRYEGP